MAAPLLFSQPVSVYLGVPPFPTLESVGSLYTCALMFASLPTVCSLIELPLLQAHPSNHGLPVEVKIPIHFPRHGTSVHDDLTVISVVSLALAHLKSYWETSHTQSLAWWINTSLCQSLLPYVINCLLIVVDTFPRAFPTNLTVETILLSYPRLLYNLI
jgi:hypothetical protein